jgi:2-polyprenyl-3-methyl-5-hydroxy-6-metoxy-1,4-benzoquinol methylase
MSSSTSSVRPYSVKTSLLSRRFALARKGQPLSMRQQLKMVEVVDRLNDGRYQLVSEPCTCGHQGEQHLIAQIDRYGLPLDSVLCMHCGTIRIDPYLDTESLSHFYREIYQELYGRTVNIPKYFIRQQAYGAKVADSLIPASNTKPLRVLEVGCGCGGALSIFKQRGHQVTGCEYDRELIDYGRSQGLENLVLGSVDETVARFGNAAFDVIYLHHVFEHVGFPLEMLQTLRGMLAPGGTLLIIVPEMEFIDSYPSPKGDALKFIHIAHKYNFSPEGLALLSRRAGLHATHITPNDQPTGWSDMPELWMTLQQSSGIEGEIELADPGARILNRLRKTEAAFGWRNFAKQAVSWPRQMLGLKKKAA